MHYIPEEWNMLFRKKIDRACCYCVHGTKLESGMILCTKKGVRESESKCRRFRYDPLKRIPHKAKALDFSRYAEDDFSL